MRLLTRAIDPAAERNRCSRNHAFQPSLRSPAMRLPRLRFTVRWMMVTVAVIALLLYGRRVQQYRLSLAALCSIADRRVRHTGGSIPWTTLPRRSGRSRPKLPHARRPRSEAVAADRPTGLASNRN